MDPDDILRRQYEQLEMEKREQALKLRTQEKRIDHLVRAMRLEEVPLLEKHMAEKKVNDREEWDRSEEERVRCLFLLKYKFGFWFSTKLDSKDLLPTTCI